MKKTIFLTEVGLRDGLQNVDPILTIRDKLHIVEGLIKAGLKQIQITSFVNKTLIPQMADAEELIFRLPRSHDVVYSGLVLNQKGLDRALIAGINQVDLSISSSETYSQKNTRMGTKEAMNCLKKMIKKAKESNLRVRAGLQCVWGCVYDGIPNGNKILKMIDDIIEMEPDIISLADSTGMANPMTISKLLEQVFKRNPKIAINLHLHDTMGLGLTNLYSSLPFGIIHYDTSFGGLGGSPFINGSTGNIPTEETVNLLEGLGYDIMIDKKKVSKISRWLHKKIQNSYFGGQIFRKL
jgi:hydroxymethylglutaryl-CoA lyase